MNLTSAVVITRVMLVMLTIAAHTEKTDHSLVPGVVIAHQPKTSRCYIGSPSLAVLPNGDYVASHEHFGPGARKLGSKRTVISRSADKGKTWEPIARVHASWSTLFVHRDKLYLIGTLDGYSPIVICLSDDGGKSWTDPVRLSRKGKYHGAPVPVVEHKGRLWRAFEEHIGKRSPWDAGKFHAIVMSAPLDADLLAPESWIATNTVAWPGGLEPADGWLEGNVVVTPKGRLENILRVNNRRKGGKAAITTISEDGKILTVDPKTFLINFPGGCKKFTIRWDDKTKCCWSLTNYIPPKFEGADANLTRNTLTLTCSADLRDWKIRDIILQHPNRHHVGWQYIDWLFDGKDIIFVSRTAYPDGLGGAQNCHDTNYMTFHRLKDFRHRQAREKP